jgi:DNA polymerase-4
VWDLFMVGQRSAQKLVSLGIRTIGDLAHANPDFLAAHFKSHGRLMWEFANGIDDSPVCPQRQDAKGVGNSTTMSEDISDPERLHTVLLTLAESVSARLRKAGQLAGTVTVEVKYFDFTKSSHQSPTLTPCNTTDEIYHLACSLFDSLWDGRPVRLLGIRTSRLVSVNEPVQLSIFDIPPAQALPDEGGEEVRITPSPDKLKKLDAAMDSIRKKYGQDAVRRGRFL